MIKTDHEAWTKAKPQMNAAFTAGKTSKCRHSKLTVANRSTPIHGVLSFDAEVAESNTAAKILYTAPRLPTRRPLPTYEAND